MRGPAVFAGFYMFAAALNATLAVFALRPGPVVSLGLCAVCVRAARESVKSLAQQTMGASR